MNENLRYPKHYTVGGVYVKELVLEKAGDKVLGHRHLFDHLSLLAKGCVKVTVDGMATSYNSPTALNIKAGKHHEIMALTDDCLWYCVHAVPAELRGEDVLDDIVSVAS